LYQLPIEPRLVVLAEFHVQLLSSLHKFLPTSFNRLVEANPMFLLFLPHIGLLQRGESDPVVNGEVLATEVG